jgi:carbon-monoxide dehydrogenase medium subunit
VSAADPQMRPFAFVRPETVEAVLAALSEAAGGRLIAGGMTLLPAMKQRLDSPSRLIALAGVRELAGIRRDGERLVVGAMARHVDIADSPAVRACIPALADLASSVGDPQVRHRGTLGGAVATNDPSGDYPAALVALDATVHTDRRSLGAEAFFTAPGDTALAADELLLRVSFPVPSRAAYIKFANPVSGYAIVGVMVAESGGAVRVAVTGAAAKVFRVPEMERALERAFEPAVLTGAGLPADLALREDLHADAAYRAHLVAVMAGRAVAAAGA